MSQLDSDSKSRAYVLPWGSNLVPEPPKTSAPAQGPAAEPLPAEAASAPVMLIEIAIPAPIQVKELARLAHQKPFHVIADLMAQNLFVTFNDNVDFAPAFKVLLKYGLLATKA